MQYILPYLPSSTAGAVWDLGVARCNGMGAVQALLPDVSHCTAMNTTTATTTANATAAASINKTAPHLQADYYSTRLSPVIPPPSSLLHHKHNRQHILSVHLHIT